jgi:hypothetical protein
MNEIHVVFMSYHSRSGPSVHHRLVMAWTGSEQLHCEVHFPHVGQSYTTDLDSGEVYKTDKQRWLGHGWESIPLAVTPEQYLNAYRHCESLLGRRFDSTGYYLFCCGPGAFFDSSAPRYVCARVVGEALLHAGLLPPRTDVVQLHTGDIYNAVVRIAPVTATRGRIGTHSMPVTQITMQDVQTYATDAFRALAPKRVPMINIFARSPASFASNKL